MLESLNASRKTSETTAAEPLIAESAPTGQNENLPIRERVPGSVRSLTEMIQVVDENPDIKGVTFDMFDTLVQWCSASEERKALVYERMSAYFALRGVQMDAESLMELRNETKRPYEATPAWKTGGEYRMHDVYVDMCSRLLGEELPSDPDLRSQALDEHARSLESIVREVDAETAVAMPGARETLEALRARGVRIGVVSNFSYSSESVRRLLGRFGLLPLIDTVVVSSDVGARKSGRDPEGRIFVAASDALGVSTDRMVHVGDEIRADKAGPEAIGMAGIVYYNESAAQKLLKQMSPDHPSYARTCERILHEGLETDASAYFDHLSRKKGIEYPSSFKQDCMLMYDAALDVYGPMLIRFCEKNLDHLLTDAPTTINLCTGRDALAMYLIQRKLLTLFPEKYGSISPNRIQYLPVSRRMILQEKSPWQLKDPEQAIRYLEHQLATGGASAITLKDLTAIRFIDSGVEGKIQDAFADALPGIRVTGEYIISNRTATGQPETRHGFMLEAGRWPEYRVEGYPAVWKGDFLHIQEDLFNGIRSSPLTISERAGALRPSEEDRAVQSATPGDAEGLPGFDMPGGYEVFKRLILKGLLDSTRMYARQEQLGTAPSVESTKQRVADWFTENNDTETRTRQIFDATVRGREYKRNPIGA